MLTWILRAIGIFFIALGFLWSSYQLGARLGVQDYIHGNYFFWAGFLTYLIGAVIGQFQRVNAKKKAQEDSDDLDSKSH